MFPCQIVDSLIQFMTDVFLNTRKNLGRPRKKHKVRDSHLKESHNRTQSRFCFLWRLWTKRCRIDACFKWRAAWTQLLNRYSSDGQAKVQHIGLPFGGPMFGLGNSWLAYRWFNELPLVHDCFLLFIWLTDQCCLMSRRCLMSRNLN